MADPISFIERLCEAITDCRLTGAQRRLIWRAIADTLAAAAAGFAGDTPAVREAHA